MCAATNGWIDDVKLLINYSADLSLKDKEGHTALGLAKEGKHKDIIDYLKNIK